VRKKMKKRALLVVLVLLAALAGACKGSQSDREAISASIDHHLQGRSDLNMGVMEHEIKQVSIQGDQATAQVEFRLKQGNGASMLVDYTLARENGQWVVTRSEPAGGHPTVDPSTQSAPQGGVHGTVPFFRDLLQNPPGAGSATPPAGHSPAGGSAGDSGSPAPQTPGSSY
jgi:hypothetical protein